MAAKRVMKALLILLTIILAVLIGLGLTYMDYRNGHVFIEDSVYSVDAESLDLREQEISIAHYEQLKASLPDCEIRWSVPFQGKYYEDDTEELTISVLNEDEIPILDYFPDLKIVHAENCHNYAVLQKLEAHRPECHVRYQVRVEDRMVPKNCRELLFKGKETDRQELEEKIPYLRNLQHVHFQEPELPAEDLLSLREQFPQVQFTWEKTAFGAALPDHIQELDISGMQGISLEEIRERTAYLPSLQKLIMSDCGFDNETMYDFREEMRPKFKVVWTVKVGRLYVRTDETWFMPTKHHVDVLDRDIDNLFYCEDMICVDVGHHPIRHVDWVAGMPHLKYLIVADGPLKDVTPLAQLKEVVWLELFMTDIRDITPLLQMTSLEDLNLARVPADLTPIAQMKWVKNLWISGGWVPYKTIRYLRENMPDTYIDASGEDNCCGRGWRQLQNYYDMRDILGMPYFLE